MKKYNDTRWKKYLNSSQKGFLKIKIHAKIRPHSPRKNWKPGRWKQSQKFPEQQVCALHEVVLNNAMMESVGYCDSCMLTEHGIGTSWPTEHLLPHAEE